MVALHDGYGVEARYGSARGSRTTTVQRHPHLRRSLLGAGVTFARASGLVETPESRPVGEEVPDNQGGEGDEDIAVDENKDAGGSFSSKAGLSTTRCSLIFDDLRAVAELVLERPVADQLRLLLVPRLFLARLDRLTPRMTRDAVALGLCDFHDQSRWLWPDKTIKSVMQDQAPERVDGDEDEDDEEDEEEDFVFCGLCRRTVAESKVGMKTANGIDICIKCKKSLPSTAPSRKRPSTTGTASTPAMKRVRATTAASIHSSTPMSSRSSTPSAGPSGTQGSISPASSSARNQTAPPTVRLGASRPLRAEQPSCPHCKGKEGGFPRNGDKSMRRMKADKMREHVITVHGYTQQEANWRFPSGL